MKFGVITDCLKIPHLEAIKLAGELGFSGVQIYATTGDFSPWTLSAEKKAEYKKALLDAGLEISALCGDMGGHGFQNADEVPERIEKTKAIVDLAVEFGSSVITTHIGVIPADKNHPRYKVMLDALTECGLYAKERGVTLAIETGPESAPVLKAFLDDTKGGVGVNLDPANFVMVTDQDPVEAVKLLGNYIVHTHAKDGLMLKRTNPEFIYGVRQRPEHLKGVNLYREVPLGEGAVDFKAYLEALEAIGYRGYLTIEREAGADPAADILIAKKHLLGVMGA